jgi:hypothetical protein
LTERDGDTPDDAVSADRASIDWIAMLHGLHGDGHPALLYFLLRSVHGITGRPEALRLVAFAVAVAAAWLIV